MNTEGQMQVHRVQMPGAALSPPAGDVESAGAVRLLHRRLRGRYALAITLAAIFGAMGIVGGYLATVPQYTSEALVQIQPTLPRVLYKTEENEMPPLFDSFVAAEATKLQSSRVFEKAVDNPKLRDVNWPVGSTGISKLKNSISVNYRRGTQVIPVQATTDDPMASRAAANALVEAYRTIYLEGDQKETSSRSTILTTRKNNLQTQITALRNTILGYGQMYGTDQMGDIYQARMNELISIDHDLFQVKQRISTLEATTSSGQPSEAQETDLSIEHLATLDPQLADLISKRDALNAELKSALRFGPKHIQTRKLQEDLNALQDRVAARYEFAKRIVENGDQPSTELTKGGSDLTLTQAKALESRLQTAYDATLATMKEIGAKQNLIDSTKLELESTQALLAETNKALEQMAVESQYSEQGRIIPIEGDVPTQPSKDRRFQLAVLGGMAGAGFGVGLVLLIGLLKPSYRYLDEIEEAESLVPVLGTLPDLNAKDDDLESLASLSIHHLRNMLAMQARPRKEGGTAFMVTSARPGDGKTSLTVALGMSFAAQGVKVLMIDADLIGHGLSPTMRMDGKPGLRQVAGSGILNDFIYESRIANLSVLPAGQSSRNGTRSGDHTAPNDAMEAEQLSSDRVHELLDDARKQFDIILVDTGPLMGSLEANVVATVVDRVVLTVPRGQDPRLLRAALGRLRSVGATCGGLVFNRATASDLRSSMSTVSFHSQSIRAAGDTGSESSAESKHALVRAILMSGHSPDSKGNGKTR